MCGQQTELKATNIVSLFPPKKKKKKKASCHFGFLKKAGRHQKGAGGRALQKRPRQNTAIVSVPRIARRCTVQCSLPNTHTVHSELGVGRQAGMEAEQGEGNTREGGSDDDRQGESVGGGRDGCWRERERKGQTEGKRGGRD